MNDPFDSYHMNGASMDAPAGGYGMHQQPTYLGFNGNGGFGDMHNYGANGMDFDPNTFSGDMGLGVNAQAIPDARLQFGSNLQRTVPMANNGAHSSHSSAASSEGSFGQRARLTRKASQKAPNVGRHQDNEGDFTSGDKTSEEDGQGSEFHQSEDEI
jgi:hypothetical protein